MKTILLLLVLGQAVVSHTIGGMKMHKCVHDTKFKGYEPKVEDGGNTAEARILQSMGSTTTTSGSTSTSTGTTGQTSTTGSLSAGTTTTTSVPTVTDGWHQMRIFVDYSYGQKFIASNSGLNSKYQMSVRLVESVRDYFQRYLTVNYMPSMTFSGGSCYNNKVAAFTKPIDLFITVAPENDPSTDYFAAATSCYLSSRDKRPTMGAYILNLAFLDSAPLNEYLYFSTFAHEFTHILGFADNLFPKYVRPGTTTPRTDVTGKVTIGTETFNTIAMPEVVSFARTYFGCPSIPGVPLENNGGDGSAGSHWEKLFLPQEYMNPTVENPGILSEFTFTLLRATGWYQIGSNAAQRYDWGKSAGCGIFQICPQGGQGYCTAAMSGQSTCSSEWMSKVSAAHAGSLQPGPHVLLGLLREAVARAHMSDQRPVVQAGQH